MKLMGSPTELSLLVADNGVGFDVQEARLVPKTSGPFRDMNVSSEVEATRPPTAAVNCVACNHMGYRSEISWF